MGDVTAVMMDVITEKSGHSVTPMAVSVCTTPAAPSPLPIPYPVVASSIEGIGDAPMRTKINGAKIGTVGSVLKTCHGNEPGTLKEVVSLNTTGPCFIIMGAPIVFVELGMMGITGSPCMQNKAPTPGAGGGGSAAGGTGGAGGGGGGGGSAGGDGSGPGGPAGGGGGGGGGSNSGASAGSSSGSPYGQCTKEGDPIDVATGHVIDAASDLSIPGLIPIEWKRFYSSSRRSDLGAQLGPGWAHGFEQRLSEDERTICLRDGEGRSVHFAKIKRGESTFHRRERLELVAEADGRYAVVSAGGELTRLFSAPQPSAPGRLVALRDPYGNTVALDYEGERLVRVIDTVGRRIELLWKQSRLVRVELRAEGRLEQWVDYHYSAAGDLASAVDALGNADLYEYDRHHRMIAATRKNGARFEFEYEAGTGRCKKSFGPKGLYAIELSADKGARTTVVEGDEPRVYTWNERGQVIREALPSGEVLIERAYDDDGFVIAETNGAGEGTQSWYDARGNLVRKVDAAGNVTAWEYAGDKPTRRIDADGLVTEFTHDDKGALAAVVFPGGLGYSLAYDERGRLSAVHGGGRVLKGYEYDARNDIIAEIDARGARTSYGYDALGRPVSATDALGRVTRVSYDRLGRPTSVRFADGTVNVSAYDALGNVARFTDGLGQTTEMEYVGTGLLARVKRADGQIWTFGYTGKEKLATIKSPSGEVYAFTYDEAGRVVSEQSFDGRRTTYQWSSSGRVARVTYADGSFRAFTYGRDGALLAEQSPDGAIAYRRDRFGRVLDAVIEEGGRRISTSFERDAAGRVIGEIQGDRRLRFTYDARGRRDGRVLPDGTTTRFTYDAGDELAQVVHAGHRLILERDAIGREIKRSDEAGRFTVHSAYDAMDRLIEQRATAPSPGSIAQVIVQRVLRYDGAGRVQRIDDGRWGTTAYRYDRVGQLLEAKGPRLGELLAYDPEGALTRLFEGLEAQSKGQASWKSAPGGRVLETPSAKYTFDARGRRVVKLELGRGDEAGPPRVSEYVWDCRDRLRELRLPDGTRALYTYDAFGRRVRKEIVPKDSGRSRVIEQIWDGHALAAELDSERGPRSFVHQPGTLVPLLQHEKGEVFTYVCDHLGTPKELIDASGRVTWAATHSAFGRVIDEKVDPMGELNRGRKVSSPFRLLGQIADEESELVCTRHRYFDPVIGGWLSPDPLGVVGGKNLYGLSGSPTTTVDPLGLEPFLYRGERSSATPDKVFADGIAPKGTNTDLLAHCSSNTAGSHFVSTSSSKDIAEGFAGKNGYVYVIDTDRGIDANKALGDKSPFPEQLEHSVPGGVKPEEIKGAYKMKGGKMTDEFIPNPNYKPPCQR
jgi:RHS repeat-associated protein